MLRDVDTCCFVQVFKVVHTCAFVHMLRDVDTCWRTGNAMVVLGWLCITSVYSKKQIQGKFRIVLIKGNTYEWRLTGSTFSDARRSKGEVVRSRQASPSGKCLFCGTWRPYMVLPMCVPASPGWGLLLRGSLFSALSPQLWTPCASLIDRSNEPFSVGRPWSWLRHGCELRLTGLSLWVTDCRYCSRHSGSFSRWWVRFLLEWLLQCHTPVEMGFLRWEFLLSSCIDRKSVV